MIIIILIIKIIIYLLITSIFQKNLQKRHEKILKELGKKLEAEQRRNDALSQEIKERNDTLKAMEKVGSLHKLHTTTLCI